MYGLIYDYCMLGIVYIGLCSADVFHKLDTLYSLLLYYVQVAALTNETERLNEEGSRMEQQIESLVSSMLSLLPSQYISVDPLLETHLLCRHLKLGLRSRNGKKKLKI